MPKPKPNRARERRITEEIVVDAHDEEERAIGWYCYQYDKLAFPFKARCIAPRTLSPLKKGEEVEVLSMAHADDCTREMFVLVGFDRRKLGVPLAQLEPVAPKGETRQAVEDWRYWVAMGYEF